MLQRLKSQAPRRLLGVEGIALQVLMLCLAEMRAPVQQSGLDLAAYCCCRVPA